MSFLLSLLLMIAVHAQAPERLYDGAREMFEAGELTGDIVRDENGHDYRVSVYSAEIRCFRLKEWNFTIRGLKGGWHQYKANDFCEVSKRVTK